MATSQTATTMTGLLRLARGAQIDPAGNPTFAVGDANVYSLTNSTGTATVTSITGGSDCQVIILVADGTVGSGLSITASATLLLSATWPASAPLTAGDTLTLMYDSNETAWVEIGRLEQ